MIIAKYLLSYTLSAKDNNWYEIDAPSCRIGFHADTVTDALKMFAKFCVPNNPEFAAEFINIVRNK